MCDVCCVVCGVYYGMCGVLSGGVRRDVCFVVWGSCGMVCVMCVACCVVCVFFFVFAFFYYECFVVV